MHPGIRGQLMLPAQTLASKPYGFCNLPFNGYALTLDTQCSRQLWN